MGTGKSRIQRPPKEEIPFQEGNIADLPVMKVDGLAYKNVEASLKTERRTLENQASEEKQLTYNLLDSLRYRDIQDAGETFSDLCVLGNVNATPGCNLYISKCQDDGFILRNTIKNKDCKVLGIFDGHGKKDGEKVSSSCNFLLTRILLGEEIRCTKSGNPIKINSEECNIPKSEELVEDPGKFFSTTFRFLHNCVISANDFSAKEAGTTATIAAVMDKTLNVAWVGDSQAALFVTSSENFEDFEGYFITSKHHFQKPEVKARVKAAGGRLGHANNLFGKIDPNSNAPLRIFGKRGNGKPGLMISRSLGDQKAHEIGLICEPSFLSINFNEITTIASLKEKLPLDFNSSLRELSALHRGPSRTKLLKSSFHSTLGKVKKRLSSVSRKKSQPNLLSEQTSDLFSQPFGLTKLQSLEEVADVHAPIKHCVLVVGSDGLWDHLTKYDIAQSLPEMLKARMAHQDVENVALELGLKSIDRFRRKFSAPNTSETSDDIAVITSVLF